jgi:hypothetical protein
MAINASTVKVPTGNLAQINRNSPRSYIELYTKGFTPSEAFLETAKLKAGYGQVPAGTILAETASGEFVPYVKTTYSADDIAITTVLVDVGSGDDACYIPNDEAAKYVVGDLLILAKGTTYHECGAITAIAEEAGRTKITFTTVTGAAFAVADSTNIYVKSGAAGKFSDAAYIMDRSADTGVDTVGVGDARGGSASIIIKHAALVEAAIWNMDTAAKTALGAIIFNRTVYV